MRQTYAVEHMVDNVEWVRYRGLMDYAGLRCHTNFSFVNGVSHPHGSGRGTNDDRPVQEYLLQRAALARTRSQRQVVDGSRRRPDRRDPLEHDR